MHYFGAHVSAAKGVHNVFSNAKRLNANALACFVRSQRKWTSPNLSQEEIESFKRSAIEHDFDLSKIVVHGSYLVNLANPEKEARQKSISAILDEVQRCESLGIKLYTFHPGSTLGSCGISEGLRLVAEGLNDVIKTTKFTRILIETMAGQGHTVGKTFEEIAKIIDQINDKNRVGVCLDTCHVFSAGYDITSSKGWEETLAHFEKTIGLQYLKAVHLNDSKCEFAHNKDRHENIGRGKIGINCFEFIVNDSRFEDMPIVLETPAEDEAVWAEEIATLRALQK